MLNHESMGPNCAVTPELLRETVGVLASRFGEPVDSPEVELVGHYTNAAGGQVNIARAVDGSLRVGAFIPRGTELPSGELVDSFFHVALFPEPVDRCNEEKTERCDGGNSAWVILDHRLFAPDLLEDCSTDEIAELLAVFEPAEW